MFFASLPNGFHSTRTDATVEICLSFISSLCGTGTSYPRIRGMALQLHVWIANVQQFRPTRCLGTRGHILGRRGAALSFVVSCSTDKSSACRSPKAPNSVYTDTGVRITDDIDDVGNAVLSA